MILSIAVQVAETSKYIAWPLASAGACLQAAYAMLKCEELYAQQCWDGSRLTPVQRAFSQKYPVVDFHFWVMYGSWSKCPDCGSFFFNDKYFSESVYRDSVTSSTPDLLAAYRRDVPTDPLEHAYGHVGESSRWWYLPGMYKPSQHCSRCTRAPRMEDGAAGMFLSRLLRKRRDEFAAGRAPTVDKTGQLYRIPRVRAALGEPWAAECVTWPRYQYGGFALGHCSGESMLQLTEEESRALQIVVLRCEVQAERYGASHQMNWKKTGLSRAYFKKDRVHGHRHFAAPQGGERRQRESCMLNWPIVDTAGLVQCADLRGAA